MATLTDIIINFGKTLPDLERLVTGFCYLTGFGLFFHAIKRLKVLADHRARSPTGVRMIVPFSYMAGGTVLFYLPTALEVARNSFFGSGSALAYGNWINALAGKYGQAPFVVLQMVKFIGVIMFLRGLILMVQASAPGSQHGMKGLVYLVAGIFMANIQFTVDQLSNFVAYFIQGTV